MRAAGLCLALCATGTMGMAQGLIDQLLPKPWQALQSQADQQGLQFDAAYTLERMQGIRGGAG